MVGRAPDAVPIVPIGIGGNLRRPLVRQSLDRGNVRSGRERWRRQLRFDVAQQRELFARRQAHDFSRHGDAFTQRAHRGSFDVVAALPQNPQVAFRRDAVDQRDVGRTAGGGAVGRVVLGHPDGSYHGEGQGAHGAYRRDPDAAAFVLFWRRLAVPRHPLLLALCAFVSSCAAKPPLDTKYTEPLSGRSYRVLVRSGHDVRRDAPVLFALHAYATAPEQLVDAFRLARLTAKEHAFIVVVPEGQRDDVGNPYWNASRACCGVTSKPPDDVTYLSGVLADVKRHFAVDAECVFALGVSNGGFMAHRWACRAGGELRGIVSISGAGVGPDDAACAASVPVRVLQIHGDVDEVIRYAGGPGTGGRYPSALETAAAWARRNGSVTEPEREGSTSLWHGSTNWLRWSGGSAPVALWTFEGGAHQLRSARFALDEILTFLGE